MRIITMKVTFDNLYFWGQGWKDGETYKKWMDFWTGENGKSGIFWTHFMKEDGFQKTQYLVGTGGSIYLHPMGFEVVYRLIGRSISHTKDGKKVEVFNEIEELKRICEDCADCCGGEVSFTEPKVFEFDY